MDYGMIGGLVFGGCLLVGLVIGLAGWSGWGMAVVLLPLFFGLALGAIALKAPFLYFVIAYFACAISLGIGYMIGVWFHLREERRPK